MELFKLLSKLGQLKEIPRAGWPLAGVPRGETEDVAQHSFDVAAITLLLYKEIGGKARLETALLMAVVHDWPEALIGDFPYPASKYLEDPEAKARMECHAAEKIFGDRRELLKAWKEFAENKTPEARLVRAADYLSILIQALRHVERGNRSKGLEELWKTVLEDLDPFLSEFPPVRKLVEQLEARRREAWKTA
jgi:putative hydrolase of HD superfamily